MSIKKTKKELPVDDEMTMFAIDLIKDAYITENPFKISKYLESIFDLKISIEEIIIILNKEGIKANKYSLSLSDIFNKI